MPVEITNELSPEMKLVADCREAVKKAEADVEKCKSELKVAKSVWETAVEELNAAIDAAIDAQRQPTLFSRFGGDDLSDPPGPASPTPNPPGDPGEGDDEGGGRRVTVEATTYPALGPAAVLPGLEAHQEPKWRKLDAAEELDGPSTLFDLLAAKGIETLGDLADALVRGDYLGIHKADLRELKEAIRDVSADDAEPIRFPELEEEGRPGPEQQEEEGEPAAPAAKAKGKKSRAKS